MFISFNYIYYNYYLLFVYNINTLIQTPTLAFYTTHTLEDICVCIYYLHAFLLQHSKDDTPLTHTRTKYSHTKYHRIACRFEVPPSLPRCITDILSENKTNKTNQDEQKEEESQNISEQNNNNNDSDIAPTLLQPPPMYVMAPLHITSS